MAVAQPFFSINGKNVGTGNLMLADGAYVAFMNVATKTYMQANSNQNVYTVGSSSIGPSHIFKVGDPQNGKVAFLGPNGYFLSGLYNNRSPYKVADVSPSITANYTWLDVVPVGNGVFAFQNASSGGFFMNLDGSNVMFSGGGIADSTSWKMVPVKASSICGLNSTNMLTDFCQTNCQQDMSSCAGAYAAFCPVGNNITTDLCKVYGKTNQSQQAIYDVWYSNYCKSNPNDTDYCGCTNPSPEAAKTEAILAKAGFSTLPPCHRASCATNTNAWKTAPMLATICPTLQICSQSLDGVIAESQVTGITFTCNQTSSNKTTTNTTTPTQATTSGGATTTNNSATNNSALSSISTNEKWWIGGGVAGGVCILSVSIALVLYYRSRRK